MSVTVVVGSQWGDEGKGKIVDLLSNDANLVARYNGGPNAGHTVVVNGEEIILHLIPCGILRSQTTCVIGNGVVVDPQVLLAELELLESKGIRCEGRLWLSDRAHLILPYHKLLEQQAEGSQARTQIGTTGRGIGPAYADKAERVGIRVGDISRRDRLQEKLSQNLQYKNSILSGVFGADGLGAQSAGEYLELLDRIAWSVADTSVLVHRAITDGKNVLIEGAQGTLLDVDHGTYPFVTSSSCVSGGACTGLGFGPSKIDTVVGVTKAYTTRVGRGPFPTEFSGAQGDELRQLGREYGATTGRPRRCGWLDLVVVNYAVRISGIDQLTITKLDVLDTLEQIDVCVAYEIDGEQTTEFPADLISLENAKPVYRSFPGWMSATGSARHYDELPSNARKYIEFIEESTTTKITCVSVGPGRQQSVLRD